MELLSIKDTKIILEKFLRYRQILENTENAEDAREILSIEILEDINKLVGVNYNTDDIKFNELLAKSKHNQIKFEDVWKEALRIMHAKEE